jgi:phosphate transport system substrate-binding protein
LTVNRRATRLLAIASAFTLNVGSVPWADDLPAYQARPVKVSPDASYVSADGRILVIASTGTQTILRKLNELFIASHPKFNFTLSVNALTSISLYSFITGRTPFALVDREMWPLETRPFRQTHGYEPTDIRIGRVGYSAPGRMNPPGIYTNAKNPLAGLTLEQVARVFTTGGGNGDITRWGQLGLSGKWSERIIHIYGPRDDGGLASAIRHSKMGGFPFARRYEPLATRAQIVQAVADDQYGLGLAGPCDAQAFFGAVRMVPLAERDGAPYSGASYEEVLAGTYPLSPCLHLYLDCELGKPCDPLATEYARLLLSREGQAFVAAERNTAFGYVPLSAREAARQLTVIER